MNGRAGSRPAFLDVQFDASHTDRRLAQTSSDVCVRSTGLTCLILRSSNRCILWLCHPDIVPMSGPPESLWPAASARGSRRAVLSARRDNLHHQNSPRPSLAHASFRVVPPKTSVDRTYRKACQEHALRKAAASPNEFVLGGTPGAQRRAWSSCDAVLFLWPEASARGLIHLTRRTEFFNRT